MRKTAWTMLACIAALLLSACAEDPKPILGQAVYTTCYGDRLTCSSNCCANQNEHALAASAEVECEVRSGPGDSQILDFYIETSNGDIGIYGEGLEYQAGTSSAVQVRACDAFIIAENGNEFPALACDNLNIRTDSDGGYGGCEIRINVDSDDVVHGEFECNELPLPGNPGNYLSVIYRGGLGVGTFTIDNCRFRL